MTPPSPRRILIIYTGGTIGMLNGGTGYMPRRRYLGPSLARLPQFHEPSSIYKTDLPYIGPTSKFGTHVAFDILEYDPLLDSSSMRMEDWTRIARDIDAHYDSFDGFVVLHGTDTMAFTASALSFMLEGLTKPVVITGSQIPISEIRNDGVDNALGALLFAAHGGVPEVSLYFHNKLMRGNRSTKLDAENLDAFSSGNFPPLGTFGIEMNIDSGRVRSPQVGRRSERSRLTVHSTMDPHVGALRLFPGIRADLIENFAKPPLRGLVLQTYGAGNAPDNDPEFLAAMRRVSDSGVVVVSCTQCFRGKVAGHYAAGLALADAGVVSGGDMTVEAALTKLSYLFGRGLGAEHVREQIGRDLRGELTVPGASPRDLFGEARFITSVAEALGEHTGAIADALYPVLLCSAAAAGDQSRIDDLLRQGANVNAPDYDGRTALHLAAAEGHADLVAYLLGEGADPSVTDRWGNTPERDAARGGHAKVVAALPAEPTEDLLPGAELSH